MNWNSKPLNNSKSSIYFVIVGLLIFAIGLFHWMTPAHHGYFLIFHIFFRKLFVIPIVLAAIWFEIKGAIVTVLSISLVYIPHILWQWPGQISENANQVGELVSLWVIALLSVILIRAEKRALCKVAETHEGSLVALITALDAREHDTKVHSIRVRAYAIRIAQELGLGRKDIDILAQASLLHDVGKIGVPDHILLKPDSLTDEEWSLMQQHAVIGHRILRAVPFLKSVADIVHAHHEKYDGTGYPNALQGNQIPQAARIFAVADVFDALTSNRPYHQKINCLKAQEIIRQGKGKHFEPKMVEAFLKISCSEWKRIDDSITERSSSVFGFEQERNND